MPNPKRRHSNHRTGIRRAHHALRYTSPTHCARCSAVVRPHRVCDNCGYYGFERGADKRGTEVFPKDEF
jgi:large subunit ribosomal protein L32